MKSKTGFLLALLIVVGLLGLREGFLKDGAGKVSSIGRMDERGAPSRVGAPIPTLPVEPEDALLKTALRKKSEAFTEFEALRVKALRTAREENQLRDLLRDPKLAEESDVFLRAEGSVELVLDEQDQRLAAVDYLRRALDWKENPNRAQVVATIEGLLTGPSVSSVERAPLLNRSLAGDRIELFHALLRSDRSRALELYREQEGQPSQVVLAYALNLVTREGK